MDGDPRPMKCIKCGKEMAPAVDKLPGEYNGETFEVQSELMRCKGCGYKTVHATQLDHYAAAVADAYRRKHDRLTSAQIRQARQRMKMSQDQFAKYLGVGIASIKRWETGQVQDPASDRLIRLSTDPSRARMNYLETVMREGWPADKYTGDAHFNFEKMAQGVLFFLSRIEEVPKAKRDEHAPRAINKLLWFADAEHYREHGRAITGLRYAALTEGPVPDDYVHWYRAMDDKGMIGYRNRHPHELIPLREFNPAIFSQEELATLEATWEKYKDRLKQLVEISHRMPAWKNTPYTRHISFELL